MKKSPLYLQYEKADRELTTHTAKWLDLIYTASILCLYDLGWRKKRIKKFIDYSEQVFRECENCEYTIIELCDTETGIEFRPEDNSSYLDTSFLCKKNWEKESKTFNKLPDNIKLSYMIREKKLMLKWTEPQILSSIALALRRKESWGADRITNLTVSIYNKLDEYNKNLEMMSDYAFNITGIRYSHII